MENRPNFTEEEFDALEERKAKVAKVGFQQIYNKLVNTINEDQALAIVELLKGGSEKEKEEFADFLVKHYFDEDSLNK